jgi:hypothetical protein
MLHYYSIVKIFTGFSNYLFVYCISVSVSSVLCLVVYNVRVYN